MALNHWELDLARMDAYRARTSQGGVGPAKRKGTRQDLGADYTHPAHLHDHKGLLLPYVDGAWTGDSWWW